MPLFEIGQEHRNRKLFHEIRGHAEPGLLSAASSLLMGTSRLMVLAGTITAFNAVDSVPTLKREWGKGSERQAKQLTATFALCFLAMAKNSEEGADAIKQAGITGGLQKFGKSAATLIASALDADKQQCLALFREFDVQSAHDVASNSMALPILVYFHA